MNVANVAFQRSKIWDRNTPKLRQDPANEVALYEEGFDFSAQRNFRYCFWLCIAFLRNWPKILEPFSHIKLHRSKIKIYFTSFTLFSRPLRWLHVSWAPKPHWFIMYCAYRNWSLDERFCLKPIYYWRIIWNSLNRIQ